MDGICISQVAGQLLWELSKVMSALDYWSGAMLAPRAAVPRDPSGNMHSVCIEPRVLLLDGTSFLCDSFAAADRKLPLTQRWTTFMEASQFSQCGWCNLK